MRKIKRLVIFFHCWWLGHEPDYNAQVFDSDPDNYGWQNTPCKCCGLWDIPYHELVEGSRNYKLKQFLIYWLYKKWRPDKCIDCGKRYGNHDNCIPF